MTHDDLLAKIFYIDPAWGLNEDFVEKNRALRAVVELHSPSEDNCQECETAYPCPTIQAIVNEFK
jgi:hypothetical protein